MKRLLIFSICLLAALSLALPEHSLAAVKRSVETVEVIDLPPIEGPKKSVAVMGFENKSGFSGEWNLGDGMAEMLTTALVNSGRFTVLERQAIGDVITEQDFAASDRTVSSKAAQIGKILNAQVLVRGAVTEFATKTSGGGGGFGFKGINLGVKTSNAHVGLHVRLYDTTTGEVIDSIRVEGKASASGLAGGYTGSALGGFTFGGDAFVKTPLGKATQQAINKAVYQIAEKMQNIPWQGKIVKVSGDTVFVNAGSESNVRGGDEFVVYRKGEDLIDPDTGISLGSEDTKVGRIQVTSVEKKFSKAKAVSGNAGDFSGGDVLKFY